MAPKPKPKPTPKPYNGENPFGGSGTPIIQPGWGSVAPETVSEGQMTDPTVFIRQKAAAAAAAARAAREAGAANFTKAPTGIQQPFANAVPDLTSGGVAPSPGAATPANVNIAPRLSARAQEEAMANRYGLTYTPGQAAGTAEQQYGDQQLRQQVEGNYANTAKALADQIAAAQDRYGANQADLKNIFGTLTTIRSADKAKINQQFTNSIQASQDQQAARTAQAQAQLKLGQQGAATAGAELGAGPEQMPTDSLTSQAVAQGIADSNANQATWGNLMGAMNMQQQGNVDTSVQGYNLQQAAALDQLRRDYEDRMLGLQGQQGSLQDQISQAIMGIKGAQVSAAQEQALQALKNKGLTDVATIRAQAALAKKSGGGSSSASTNKLKSVTDIWNAASAAGVSPNYIINNANNAILNASADLNQGNDGTKGMKSPTAAQALAQFNLLASKSANFTKIAPLVTAYIQSQLK